MRLNKNIIAITLMAIFSTSAIAETTSTPLNSEDFKAKLNNILNQPKVLTINTPEEYIYNLNTTEFVKGLMYETVLVMKFLAENSDDDVTLASFNKEYTVNSSCFAEVIGSSGNHFNTLFNLTLKTPELKDKYNKGYSFMVNSIERYPIEKEYHDLCRNEKLKAIEYTKSLEKQKKP
jgi:hypothetical protein